MGDLERLALLLQPLVQRGVHLVSIQRLALSVEGFVFRVELSV